MREILFRAFNKNTGVMLDNVPVCNGKAMTWRNAPKDSPVITLEGKDGNTNFYCDWDFLKEDPYLEVMQFTGLTDCNGVKIFEGDVVTLSSEEGGLAENFVVKWDEEGFWRIQGGSDWFMLTDFDIEVIGNIHQHKELLK